MNLKYIFRKYRKLFIVGGIVVTLAIVLLLIFSNGEDDTEESVYVPKVKTWIVASGLEREITTTGEVQAAKSATLTAEIRGDVRSVAVKVGDEVRAGQLLVQLSSDSLESSRSTAGTALANAQNSLAQTQLSTEKSIEAARVALTTAEINLANTIQQNTALQRQAEETLNAAKLSSGLSVSSAETTLENAIRSAYPTSQKAISECDEIIGVSSIYKNANDTYENLLGALKSSTKSEAENAITTALSQIQTGANDYDSAVALLRSAELATMKTLDVLNNSATSTNLTQTTLNSHVSTINTQLSYVRTAISTLETAKSALDSAQQSTDGGSQAIVSAQATYDSTLAQIQTSEQSASQAVESARAALESAERSAQLTQVGAKTSLDAARGNLSQAQISQNKLIVSAPFNGKVTAVEIEPGDQISAGGTLVRVEDASQLKLVAYLSSSEVRKIKIGDEVRIATKSFDTISAISPSADPITKKYKVEILHDNSHLRSGEFVKLRFDIGEKNGATDKRIFLPITAINVLKQGSFVWKIEAGKIIKTEVELGDLEGEFVEIVSGLMLNEEVIVEGGRILEPSNEGEEVEIVN